MVNEDRKYNPLFTGQKDCLVIVRNAALQKKNNAEIAYLKSNKLLPFGFIRILESSNPSPRL